MRMPVTVNLDTPEWTAKLVNALFFVKCILIWSAWFCWDSSCWTMFILYVLSFYIHADINECSSSPCVNGGTCVDQVNGYVCICKPGYSGWSCESSKCLISVGVTCCLCWKFILFFNRNRWNHPYLLFFFSEHSIKKCPDPRVRKHLRIPSFLLVFWIHWKEKLRQ